MRISILGCGWLGFPLGVHFINKGYQVSGSTTREERFNAFNDVGIDPYLVKAINGQWQAEDLMSFIKCDTLIVAIPPGTRKNPDSMHDQDIKMLIEWIETQKHSISKIIYISSTSVYKSEDRLVFEGDIHSEADAENKILFRAEQYVLNSSIPDKLILRLGGLTGYDRMLGRFFSGKKELGGGNEPVNLVHRDDVIRAIDFLIEKQNTNKEIYNICSPFHPSKELFYTELCKRFNLALPIFPTELHSAWKEVSSQKISDLGFRWVFENPSTYTYTYSF